jgi:hypothetical protein
MPRSPKGRAAARGLDARLSLQQALMPAGDASLKQLRSIKMLIDSNHGIYCATGYLAAERRCAISTTTRASGISVRTVWPSHKMRDQIICLKSGYDIQQL